MVQFTSCIQEVTYVGLVGVKPFLYFGHILLRLWMVGWRFYAVFAFEKWSNMSFVKSAFFLTYFILGPFTPVLNDLRFPLISKENIPFMDQVDHIIHFWFLKQITLEYWKSIPQLTLQKSCHSGRYSQFITLHLRIFCVISCAQR